MMELYIVSKMTMYDGVDLRKERIRKWKNRYECL